MQVFSALAAPLALLVFLCLFGLSLGWEQVVVVVLVVSLSLLILCSYSSWLSLPTFKTFLPLLPLLSIDSTIFLKVGISVSNLGSFASGRRARSGFGVIAGALRAALVALFAGAEAVLRTNLLRTVQVRFYYLAVFVEDEHELVDVLEVEAKDFGAFDL